MAHQGTAYRVQGTGCRKGQSMIEFTYAATVVMVLLGAMIFIFRWAMMDMAERRFDHDHILTTSNVTPEEQLTAGFHKTRRMDPFLFSKGDTPAPRLRRPWGWGWGGKK